AAYSATVLVPLGILSSLPMSNPRGRSPMRAGVAEAVGRFRPAVLTPHELVRSRLLSRVTLENALGAPHCTLIAGPAGFGKTTLLAQAYRQLRAQGDSTIWLECNEHDAEPSHFLHSLYAAGSAAGIDTTDPEFNTSDFGHRAAQLGANVCLCVDAL